jgi:hypothetical protein
MVLWFDDDEDGGGNGAILGGGKIAIYFEGTVCASRFSFLLCFALLCFSMLCE